MMKIQILSDLHNDFKPFEYQRNDSDVVVLAGDIDEKHKGLAWALETITDKAVMYVLGNHEFYHDAYPKLIGDLKKIAQGTNVYMLENDVFTYEDVNFIGCTLWTDLKLHGNQSLAVHDCQRGMQDFRIIRHSKGFSRLHAEDTIDINSRSVEFLNRELDTRQGQKNVVITHHTPSSLSESETYKGSRLSPAFASNLDDLVEKADIWMHGHMHHSVDYQIGNCRVICNPRGYASYEINKFFQTNFIVEI